MGCHFLLQGIFLTQGRNPGLLCLLCQQVESLPLSHLHVTLCVCKLLSRVQLCVTPRTVACQAPLSMGLSRQEYGNSSPCLSPGDLPDLGTEPRSPTLQVDSLLSEPPGKTYVTLYAIKCFASMIKLRILRVGYQLGVFGWIQCNHKGCSKGKRETGESEGGIRMVMFLALKMKKEPRNMGLETAGLPEPLKGN